MWPDMLTTPARRSGLKEDQPVVVAVIDNVRLVLRPQKGNGYSAGVWDIPRVGDGLHVEINQGKDAMGVEQWADPSDHHDREQVFKMLALFAFTQSPIGRQFLKMYNDQFKVKQGEAADAV